MHFLGGRKSHFERVELILGTLSWPRAWCVRWRMCAPITPKNLVSRNFSGEEKSKKNQNFFSLNSGAGHEGVLRSWKDMGFVEIFIGYLTMVSVCKLS